MAATARRTASGAISDGLMTTALPASKRRDDVAEREVERRVPRTDDPDDAARLEHRQAALAEERTRADALRSEPPRGAAGQVPDVDADPHQLADDVESRLAGLAFQPVEDLGAGPHHLAPRPLQQPRPVPDRQRTPRRLSGTRPFDGRRYRRSVIDGQLFDRRTTRRITHDKPRWIAGVRSGGDDHDSPSRPAIIGRSGVRDHGRGRGPDRFCDMESSAPARYP